MKHIHYDIPKLTRIDVPDSPRLYQTPEGNCYPSVTSIVGSIGADYIKSWRDKVGHEVADGISRRAANRGTLIHENCELYLQGKPLTFGMFHGTESTMFKQLIPVLDSITEIHALETQLYSDRLQCAGTVDLICRDTGNELMVLDWKTSNRYKTADDISGYFMQCSAYAYMFYERTGVAIKRIKVVMTTEEFGLLLFEENVQTWLPKFIQVRQSYQKE